MALATEIYQEGFRLPPVKIVEAGGISRDVLALFLANTRVSEEREGDLRAQLAALSVGADRLRALVKTTGRPTVTSAMNALKDYSARLMAAALGELPRGTYRARDFLDDDGVGATRIPIEVAIRIGGGRAIVDFTGSAPQVRGSVNANYAITLSATFYVMKCLATEAVPANEGLMRPIELVAPEPDRSSTHWLPPRSRAATSRPRSESSMCCFGRSRRPHRTGFPRQARVRCRISRSVASIVFVGAIFLTTKRLRAAPGPRPEFPARREFILT